MRILDLGCGSGLDPASWGVTTSDEVTGLDIDDDRLAIARVQFPKQTYLHGAGERLPFEDESFDRVISAVPYMGKTWLWGWLNWSLIRYLGQVSYGMFLYHVLANRLVIDLFGRHSLWIHVPAVIAGAALLGAGSFHMVERRFLRLKSKFTGNSAKKPASTVAQDYQLARS
jgi:SAM-dependent methyltransferase